MNRIKHGSEKKDQDKNNIGFRIKNRDLKSREKNYTSNWWKHQQINIVNLKNKLVGSLKLEKEFV